VRRADSTTQLSNRWVRVYYVSLKEDFYACSYETGRVSHLGSNGSSSSGYFEMGPVVLAGRFVAWSTIENCANPGCSLAEHLVVLNARSGRGRLRHRPARNEVLGSFVQRASGATGWLYGRRDEATGTGEVVLRRHDARGEAVVARGSGDQAPRWLTLTGATMSWLEGDRLRTKTLR
jgi:hypothetical protein